MQASKGGASRVLAKISNIDMHMYCSWILIGFDSYFTEENFDWLKFDKMIINSSTLSSDKASRSII